MSARPSSSVARKVNAEPVSDVPLTDTYKFSTDPSISFSIGYQPYEERRKAVGSTSPHPLRSSQSPPPVGMRAPTVGNPTAYVGLPERTSTAEGSGDHIRAARGSDGLMPQGGDHIRAARGSDGLNPEGVAAARGADPSDPLEASAVRGAGPRGRSPRNARARRNHVLGLTMNFEAVPGNVN